MWRAKKAAKRWRTDGTGAKEEESCPLADAEARGRRETNAAQTYRTLSCLLASSPSAWPRRSLARELRALPARAPISAIRARSVVRLRGGAVFSKGRDEDSVFAHVERLPPPRRQALRQPPHLACCDVAVVVGEMWATRCAHATGPSRRLWRVRRRRRVLQIQCRVCVAVLACPGRQGSDHLHAGVGRHLRGAVASRANDDHGVAAPLVLWKHEHAFGLGGGGQRPLSLHLRPHAPHLPAINKTKNTTLRGDDCNKKYERRVAEKEYQTAKRQFRQIALSNVLNVFESNQKGGGFPPRPPPVVLLTLLNYWSTELLSTDSAARPGFEIAVGADWAPKPWNRRRPRCARAAPKVDALLECERRHERPWHVHGRGVAAGRRWGSSEGGFPGA